MISLATIAGRFHAPRDYTRGVTYRLADMPTTEETGVTFRDLYQGAFRAVPTGEKRAPKAGEWYLSGAVVEAYKARGDFDSEYLIAKLVRVERVPAVETYRIIG